MLWVRIPPRAVSSLKKEKAVLGVYLCLALFIMYILQVMVEVVEATCACKVDVVCVMIMHLHFINTCNGYVLAFKCFSL